AGGGGAQVFQRELDAGACGNDRALLAFRRPGVDVRRAASLSDEHRTVRRAASKETNDGCIGDRKSTRLNSSHLGISYAVFCLKAPAPSAIVPLSLHDALPICAGGGGAQVFQRELDAGACGNDRALLAFRRPGVDVRRAASLSDEHRTVRRAASKETNDGCI